MIHFRSVIYGALVATLLGWIAILVTSHGPLVSADRLRPANAASDMLVCRYFTGFAVVSVEFRHSPDGIDGHAACPRLHVLSP
jgi:hypothetical protein